MAILKSNGSGPLKSGIQTAHKNVHLQRTEKCFIGQ